MPEKKKDPYRFLSFKFFILTFLITLIILCLVGLPILLASGQDPSSQSSKPEEYTPDWSDKMTLLLQIKEESGTPLRFFLVGLHPAQERLYVTPLPGETWLSAGQKENTPYGFYRIRRDLSGCRSVGSKLPDWSRAYSFYYRSAAVRSGKPLGRHGVGTSYGSYG